MTTRSRTLAVALLTAASLTLAAPATAAPDDGPPPAPPDTCAATLDRAAAWPGSIPLDGGVYRVVSDAFTTHLAGLPACAGPAA